jgi:hypothetical protein
MVNISADAAHLRELAARCRSIAAGLTDRIDVASLRRMAAEYEAMANGIDQPRMPNPQPPIRH